MKGMEPRRKKIYIYALCGACALGVIAAAFFFLLKRTASYRGMYSGNVGAEVTISRDAHGIPRVTAATPGDAYFALGYLHAQDRLILIEYFRAVACGRLSELEGDEAVDIDTLSRIVGFRRSAQELYARLDAPYKDYIDAYVSGINFLKRTKFKELIELSSAPAHEWSGADVIAILYMNEWADAFMRNKELYFPLPKKFKAYPLADAVPADLLYWYEDSEQKNIFILKEIKKIVEKYIAPHSSGFALFVPGELASDGIERLCYNLDDSLRLYPAWYPLEMRIGGTTIRGASAAGLPFVLIGKNDSMTFAGFRCAVDTQDFYIEETRDDEIPDAYLSQGAWKKFEHVRETVYDGRNKGGKGRAIDIRSTDRGPVISDAFSGRYKTDVITMRSLVPGKDYIRALFEMPLAENIAQARRLVANITSLPVVCLFSSQGKTMKAYAGKAPVRDYPDSIFKKDFPATAWKGMLDLSGHVKYIDRAPVVIGDEYFDDSPAVLKSYIASDNSARFAELERLVREKGSIDMPAMKALLRDSHSSVAAKFVPLALPLIEKMLITSARLARIYFNNWDYTMGIDSVPASIYQVLMVRMIQETMADELMIETEAVIDNVSLISDRFLDAFIQNKSPLFDDVTTPGRTEDRDAIFDRAFLKTMRFLNKARGPIMEDWTWGAIHRGHYTIPLVRDDAFMAKMFLDYDNVAYDGSFATVRRGTFDIKNAFAAGEVTALSAIQDDRAMYIRCSFGYSLNPFSEFFGIKAMTKGFAAFDASGKVHNLKIAPVKK